MSEWPANTPLKKQPGFTRLFHIQSSSITEDWQEHPEVDQQKEQPDQLVFRPLAQLLVHMVQPELQELARLRYALLQERQDSDPLAAWSWW